MSPEDTQNLMEDDPDVNDPRQDKGASLTAGAESTTCTARSNSPI